MSSPINTRSPNNGLSTLGQGVTDLNAYVQNVTASLDRDLKEYDQILINAGYGKKLDETKKKNEEYESLFKMKEREIDNIFSQMRNLMSNWQNSLNTNHAVMRNQFSVFMNRVENGSKFKIKNLENRIKELREQQIEVLKDSLKEFFNSKNKDVFLNSIKKAQDIYIPQIKGLENQLEQIKDYDNAKIEVYINELNEQQVRDRLKHDEAFQNLKDQLDTKQIELTQINNEKIAYGQKVSYEQSKIFELIIKQRKAELEN